MSPPRRGDSGRARTAAERERDRLERERRRVRERGAASPIDDGARSRFEAEPPPPYEAHDHPPPPYEALDHPPPASTEVDHPPPASAEVDHTPPADAEVDHPPAYDGPKAEEYAAPIEHEAFPPWADDGARTAPPSDPGDGARPPWADEGAPRRRRDAPAPASGAPAALARASAAVSTAAAALAGAAAAGRARLPKRPERPERPGARAGRPGEGGGGSLRRAPRPRTRPGRPISAAGGPGARPRTPPVSRTKQNLSAPAAPRGRAGRVAAVIALVAVVFALWFLFSLFQPFKGGGTGTVAVDIPRGASSSQIGTLLADRGVISSGFFFKLRATLAGKRSQLGSGHFQLRRDMSYGAALDALTSKRGTAKQITVTIPEGLSRTEIAAVAKRMGVTGNYVKASLHSHVLKPSAYGGPATAHSLEGFLFPSTYDLLPGDRASKLVNAQLLAFQTNLAKVDLSAARRKHLSAYDVVTIASMVEREAQRASERPLIAAVIYNRLHQGIPLGIDATIRYAINDYLRPLTVSDLALTSPYNTRLHKGLPPTPIGNPGLASLQAAAHPAAVSYLYYVVKPGACGQHAFSTTFSQFQQDVARYNAARSAKGGNSPTSCTR